MTARLIAIALGSALIAPFVSVTATASWGCIAPRHCFTPDRISSSFAPAGKGDLGQTYPIARRCSPFLLLLGAAVFAREPPDLRNLTGVPLGSGGVVALAFKRLTIKRETSLISLHFKRHAFQRQSISFFYLRENNA